MPVLIVCHATADFDALAGACGMALLHPGAQIILPGGSPPAVTAFIREFGLPAGTLAELKRLDFSAIERLILIDCHDPAHLGALSGKLPSPTPPIEVVDHHPGAAPPGAAPVPGATSTLVVQRLRAAKAAPSPLLATLLLIGIHEDTGSLTYNDARAADAEAVAWLLGYSPDPGLLRRYLKFHAEAAPGALIALLRATEILHFGRCMIALATLEPETGETVSPAATEALNEVLALTGASGAVLLTLARGRAGVTARGDGLKFDAGALCSRLGGGGHPTAASAALGHLPAAAARQALLGALTAQFPPPRAAGDLMRAPLVLITHGESVQTALSRLQAARIRSAPVTRSGRPVTAGLIGVVTQQALSEAVRLGHGDSPAAAFAHDAAPLRPAAMALTELAGEALLAPAPLYLLAGARGRLLGAVSRRRLLAAVSPAAALPAGKITRVAPEFLAARLKSLPAPQRALLEALLRAAKAQQEPLWLVGGPVRDLLLEQPTGDLDLAAAAPLRKLLAPLGKNSTIVFHDRFATARIVRAGAAIDLARTRREHYPRPGALPEVAPAEPLDDLRRRDFTLNAMAIRLGDAAPELIDPLGGLADLRAGRLRALHALSFIEDPTRMLRAVRFLARFHFTLAPDTARLLRDALRLGALSTVSRERLLAELRLLAAEPEPLRALEWLDELGLLTALLPGASARGTALAAARALYSRVALHAREFPDEPLDRLSLFLLPPLHALNGAARAAAVASLPLPVAAKKLLGGAKALRWRLLPLLRSAGAAQLCARLDTLRIEELLWLAALSSSREAALTPAREPAIRLLDEYIRSGRNRRPHLDGTALKALGVKPGPVMGRLLRELTARVRAGELKTRAAETRFIKASLKADAR